LAKKPEKPSETTTVPGREITVPGTPAAPSTGGHAACLVVIYGDELGKRITLARGALTIGRSSKNDVQLDADSVSRVHCEIRTGDDAVTLVDRGSTNGTYVNDRLAQGELVLRDGDQVKVGGAIFKFLTGGNMEAHYHEEIYRLMTVDGLTQVYNKRYFMETLERELGRSTRYRRELSLVMFDIDHFKKINDTYGHLAGDQVLKTLALTVKGRIRREDIPARYGGEEFAIVLPEIDGANARQFAEKIRRLVETTDFFFEGTKIDVTISMGVATLDNDTTDAAALIKRADEHLYEAKRAGRNCVRS
jgi:diguanylate cyclase (GGDEF)-like protein